jgi:hypothetical protein
MNPCSCFENTNSDHYQLTLLGVDKTAGRFAEVEIGRCGLCQRYWLHYSWEIEGFTKSGRWYRAPITWHQSQNVTAGNATSLLENADWYFESGSYSGGNIQRAAGPIR